MENEEKDIIHQLADRLRESELPYKEGAWERFAAMEAGKAKTATGIPDPIENTGPGIRSIRRWISIAAVLVLAAGAGWLYMTRHNNQSRPVNPDKPSSQIATTTPAESPAEQKTAVSGKKDQSVAPVTGSTGELLPAGYQKRALTASASGNRATVNQPSEFRLSFPYVIERTEVIRRGERHTQRNSAAAGRVAGHVLAAIDDSQPRRMPGLSISSESPAFPYKQTSSPSTDEKKLAISQPSHGVNMPKTAVSSGTLKEENSDFDDAGYFDLSRESSGRKWNMGVVVIPAVSNTAKLNMGYGVSVGYRLSNRLSINSGLAYTELSGSKDAVGQASIASSGRTLSSIDATATGLNVPLELRYHISRKIYLGTGVSAMAVLSDKVERKYAIAEMQTSAFEAKNGQPLKPDAMQSIASDIRTKEVLPEDQAGSKDFAGFINFSFGFRQPLNKSKSLSIEPFISIPMSNHLFNQNIKMTDGGLRIKLGL